MTVDLIKSKHDILKALLKSKKAKRVTIDGKIYSKAPQLSACIRIYTEDDIETMVSQVIEDGFDIREAESESDMD